MLRLKNIIRRAINKVLAKFSYISSVATKEKIVYLTFDDGPEPGITEFILAELDKYKFKATFFCRGDNAVKHSYLFSKLRLEGHTIGNHTYSHLNAYKTTAKEYIEDVKQADNVLHTSLFRPPHGSLTINSWIKVCPKYKIYFWSLNSNDYKEENFNLESSMSILQENTQAGDIVLFHFCHKHEKETKKILPLYLKWLSENEFKCGVLMEEKI